MTIEILPRLLQARPKGLYRTVQQIYIQLINRLTRYHTGRMEAFKKETSSFLRFLPTRKKIISHLRFHRTVLYRWTSSAAAEQQCPQIRKWDTHSPPSKISRFRPYHMGKHRPLLSVAILSAIVVEFKYQWEVYMAHFTWLLILPYCQKSLILISNSTNRIIEIWRSQTKQQTFTSTSPQLFIRQLKNRIPFQLTYWHIKDRE